MNVRLVLMALGSAAISCSASEEEELATAEKAEPSLDASIAPARDATLTVDCSLVGCSSGVTIQATFAGSFSELLALNAEFCRNDRCASRALPADVTPPAFGEGIVLVADAPWSTQADEHIRVTAWLRAWGAYDLEITTAASPDVLHDGDRYRLRLIDAKGAALLAVEDTVTYERYRPNGAACGPTCLRARIAAESERCYSPLEAPDRQARPEAAGCACLPSASTDYCVDGWAVSCDGRWSFGADGYCAPTRTPDRAGSCQDLGGVLVAERRSCPSGFATRRGYTGTLTQDAGSVETDDCCYPIEVPAHNCVRVGLRVVQAESADAGVLATRCANGGALRAFVVGEATRSLCCAEP